MVRFERSFKDDALVGNPFDHAVRFLHRFEGEHPTGAWFHAGLLARDSARCPMGDVRRNGECVKDLRWSRLDQGGEPDVRRAHRRMIGTHAVPTPLGDRLQIPEAHPPCILDGTARRLPDRNPPMRRA